MSAATAATTASSAGQMSTAEEPRGRKKTRIGVLRGGEAGDGK
jgi:hypothetical protein